MATIEESVHVVTRTPPRCDAVDDVLVMKPLSPRDKVQQFFEEQEQQKGKEKPVNGVTDAALAGEVQDLTPLADLTILEEQLLSAKPQDSTQGKKRKSNSTKQHPSSKKRHRGDQAEGDSDDPVLLFRRSQKALRKEARHVNMKEVLCRSLIGTLDAPNDASNPFSPTGASQSSSTWSPTIATSITNRFLSNVQQQKKQTFERLMQKEMTSSQLSFSRLTGDDGESNDGMPELVIGDETAIMEPPVSERDILPVESPPEVGGSSLFDAPLLGGNTSRSFIELDEEKEQAQSEALMRKHELWRLRQKHLREQLHAEKAVSQLKRTEPQSSHAQAPTTTTTTTPTTAVVSSSAVSARVSTGDVNGSFDVLMVTQRSVMQRAHGATLGLSTDHIDMIRRVNNFDNTSSQRVVVFEAKSSKQGLASSSSSSKHQGKL